MGSNVFQSRDTYCGHEPCDGGRRSVGAEDWIGARVEQVPTERTLQGGFGSWVAFLDAVCTQGSPFFPTLAIGTQPRWG